MSSQLQTQLKPKKQPTSTEKALLFLDVVSSSKMWKNNATEMNELLNLFEKAVNKIMKSYDSEKNFIVKTIGDAYMICFDQWENALEFALKIQQRLARTDETPFVLNYGNNESMPFAIRIGIAHGPVEQKTLRIQNCNMKDLFGNTVNTASRMESKVSPVGGIGITCLSKESNVLQNFVDKLISFLEKNDLNFKVLSFKNDCKRNNNANKLIQNALSTQNDKTRSNRLITQLQENYSCDHSEKLHGVDDVEICFKIEVNQYPNVKK